MSFLICLSPNIFFRFKFFRLCSCFFFLLIFISSFSPSFAHFSPVTSVHVSSFGSPIRLFHLFSSSFIAHFFHYSLFFMFLPMFPPFPSLPLLYFPPMFPLLSSPAGGEGGQGAHLVLYIATVEGSAAVISIVLSRFGPQVICPIPLMPGIPVASSYGHCLH